MTDNVINDLEIAKRLLASPSSLDMSMRIKVGQAITEAIELLKRFEAKETPMRPVKDKKNPRFGMGNEYYDWMCPVCEWFLAFEPAYERIPNRCPHCNQKLIRPTREEAESM